MPSDLNKTLTQKRKLSPDQSALKSEEKKIKMEDKIDNILKSITELTALVKKTVTDISLINTAITNIQTEMSNMNLRISTTEESLISARNGVSKVSKRVDDLEIDKNTLAVSQQNQLSAINSMEQIKMVRNMTIHNIPQELELDKALLDIGRWSGFQLSRENLKSARLTNQYRKKYLHLEFWQEKDKFEFNRNIKSKQKNPDGSYIPVLCENVFELDVQSTSRGVELLFRQPMTEINREIFNEARKHREVLKFVWIGGNGHVMVKQDEKARPTVIHSLEHLATVIELIKNPIKKVSAHS